MSEEIPINWNGKSGTVLSGDKVKKYDFGGFRILVSENYQLNVNLALNMNIPRIPDRVYVASGRDSESLYEAYNFMNHELKLKPNMLQKCTDNGMSGEYGEYSPGIF